MLVDILDAISDFVLDDDGMKLAAPVALPVCSIFELALKDVVAAFAVVAAYFVSHDSDEKDDKEKSHWLP
jgi:hypothetical protein